MDQYHLNLSTIVSTSSLHFLIIPLLQTYNPSASYHSPSEPSPTWLDSSLPHLPPSSDFVNRLDSPDAGPAARFMAHYDMGGEWAGHGIEEGQTQLEQAGVGNGGWAGGGEEDWEQKQKWYGWNGEQQQHLYSSSLPPTLEPLPPPPSSAPTVFI